MSDRSERPQSGDVLVMVGTRKGTFLFWSDPARRVWHHSHHQDEWSVHALNYDKRNGTIYAATNHNYLNERAGIQRSADGGVTWQTATAGLDFDDDRHAWQIWQIVPGHPQRPGEMWAGSREAGLFRSHDSGQTWASVAGLNDHPTRTTWEAGGGGLLLHTILIDPDDSQRLYACVSMGGAFRSEDGGITWQPINHRVPDHFLGDNPATRLCVHNESWVDISEGLPSRFGFSLALHPHDPDTVYVVPHISEKQRVVPGKRMAIWRSRDGGENWESLHVGLPDNAWLTILRESLAVDSCDPAGVYAGTNTGQVFYSRDEGLHWDVLADFLPGVIAINAARMVG